MVRFGPVIQKKFPVWSGAIVPNPALYPYDSLNEIVSRKPDELNKSIYESQYIFLLYQDFLRD